MTPHICEELWEKTGHSGEHLQVVDAGGGSSVRLAEKITLVVQINSRIRAREEIDADLPESEVERIALANPRIQELLAGQTPRKIVVIKNKLVNIIV